MNKCVAIKVSRSKYDRTGSAQVDQDHPNLSLERRESNPNQSRSSADLAMTQHADCGMAVFIHIFQYDQQKAL
jgi:hypothetical protein